MRRERQEQEQQREHQRIGRDDHKTVGLLVVDGCDRHEHGQTEYFAQLLLGAGEQVADGERHNQEQQTKADETRQMWQDENIDQAAEGHTYDKRSEKHHK